MKMEENSEENIEVADGIAFEVKERACARSAEFSG
jgi:hypothetical protein